MKQWLVLVLLFVEARCDGFSDQVFQTITVGEGNACYRTFNKTHEFGCQANSKNQNGLIVRIDRDEDFENLKTCWKSQYPGFSGHFWTLLPVNLVRRDTISMIKSSECLAGIILYDSGISKEKQFAASHDSECPNAASDFYLQDKNESYCERKVNLQGSITPDGLMRIDWRIQMVFINNFTDLQMIEKCHSMFNIPRSNGTFGYPYCGMSFRLSNMAAGNSEICYRRGKNDAKLFQMNIDSGDAPLLCGAMHSDNIFAFPTPIPTSPSNETVITSKYMMVTSRMDSFGMIPEVSVGEISVLTSLISVLAAARTMGTQIEKWQKASNASNRNVFFSFFNGESLDYIGSGAAAYQMEKGFFPQRLRESHADRTHIHPIRVDELDYVLEVQQIGVSKGRKYYVHVDGERYVQNKTQTDRLIDRMERGLRSHGFDLEKLSDIESRVPPSSWHSFAKADSHVQSLLIAPFNEEYEYSRINSILDRKEWSSDSREKAIQEIEAVATSILTVSADYIGLETDGVIAKVDKNLIATLFDCLITSKFWFDCDFMKKLDGGRYHKLFYSYGFNEKSTYISMESHTAFPIVLHWLTIFALGSDKETLNVKSEKSCSHLGQFQAMYTYTWQPSPYTGNFSCLKSAIVKKVMISPALDPYTPKEEMNTRYSTWMESVYMIESVNLYLMEDESFEFTMIFIALASALLSMFAVGRCSESTFIVDEGEPAAEGGEPL